MFKVISVLIICLFLMSGNTSFDDGKHLFVNPLFQPGKCLIKKKVLINFNDSIPDDTLTIYFSEPDLPSAFSRDIHTAVCLDTLCRVVDITLYWEITGKYLGFSLPSGTQLTKKEHTPFSEKDYSRLNEILSDSSSQLRTFTPEDIHPVKKSVNHTDGITGATLPDLASWIVPEAAYSSYTLWHITYGETRDTILTYTYNQLVSDQLLIKLLNEDDPYDQVKALQWSSSVKLKSSQYNDLVIRILHGKNYKSSGQALQFLKRNGMDLERLQKEVIPLLDSEDFRIKYVAIEYFRECQLLRPTVAREMMSRLYSDNYYLVNVILTLFEKRFQPDWDDQRNLSKLLANKNINIANRVYHFLLNLPDHSPALIKQLNRYRRKAL